MQTGDHRQHAFSNGDRANFAICCASLYPEALCDAKETRASLKSKLKQINACSSPIFCSERPDMQVISARKADWTFPIVICNIRDSKMFSRWKVETYSVGEEGNNASATKITLGNHQKFLNLRKHFCFPEANFVSARKFPFKQGIESQMFLQHWSL
jgi:hypothetical protein